MKRNLLLLLGCLMGLTVFAGPISQQEALSQAKSYLQKQRKTQLLGVRPQQEVLSLAYTCMSKASRGSMSSSNPLYYVFNRGNDGGFIVVAGDDRMQPIMACTEHGTFDKHTENPGLKWWLGAAQEMMATVVAAPEDEEKQVKGVVPQGTDYVVAPLIKTQWNQGEPYNRRCPEDHIDGGGVRSATGCVGTAVAQILYYWHGKGLQDPTGTMSYTTGNHKFEITEDFSTYQLQWDLMLPNYNQVEATEEQKNAVADLMYVAGVCQTMDYCATGSSTRVQPNLLEQHFDIDPGAVNVCRRYFKVDEWDAMIKKELDLGRPVQYNGGTAVGAGHAFICDGYKEGGLYHINWGWGGHADGDYLLTILQPDDHGQIGSANTGTGYIVDPEAVIGFQPRGYETINPKAQPVPVKYQAMYDRFVLVESELDRTDHHSMMAFDGVTSDDNRFTGLLDIAVLDKDGRIYDKGGQISTTGYVPMANQSVNVSDLSYMGAYPRISIYFSCYWMLQADGEYQLVPICKEVGAEQWHPMTGVLGNNEKNTIWVSMKNRVVTFIDKPAEYRSQLTAIAQAFAEPNLYAGHQYSLSLSLNNAGNMYQGIIGLTRNSDFTTLSRQQLLAQDYFVIDSMEQNKVIVFPYKAATRDEAIKEGDVLKDKLYVVTCTSVYDAAKNANVDVFEKIGECNSILIDPQLAVAGEPLAAGGAYAGVHNKISIPVKNNGTHSYKNALKLKRFISTGKYEDIEGATLDVDLAAGATETLVFNLMAPNSASEDRIYVFFANNNEPIDLVSPYKSYALAPNVPVLTASKADFSCSPDRLLHVGENELTLQFNVTSSSGIYEGRIALDFWLFNAGKASHCATYFTDLVRMESGTKTLTKTIDVSEMAKGIYYIQPKYYDLASNTWKEVISLWSSPMVALSDMPSTGGFVRLKNLMDTHYYLTAVKETGNAFTPMIGNATPSVDNILYYNASAHELISYISGFSLAVNNTVVGTHGVLDKKPAFDIELNPNSANYRLKCDAQYLWFYESAIYAGVPDDDYSNYQFNVEKVTSLPVTLNFVEGQGAFATLWSPVALQIPEGMKAYIGQLTTEGSNTILKLKRIEGNIPAETGVVLWSEAGMTSFEMPIAEGVLPFEGVNDLVGTAEASHLDFGMTYLSLGVQAGQVGFYKYKGDQLNGFRARLALPESQLVGVKGFILSFEDQGVTGIPMVESTDQQVKVIYDLSGRRVAHPGKGVYIVNGQKVFIK